MILSDNEATNTSEVQEMDVGNASMADAMRKVLSIGKNSSKTSIVLAKAKVLTKKKKLKPKNPGFEIEKTESGTEEPAEVKEEEEDVKDEKLFRRKRMKMQAVATRGRTKPSALDREKERPLAKIATRGVVQLFNAVREQQKVIEKKIGEVGPSVTKREKVMKSIDKKAFLDVLRGCKSGHSPEPDVKMEDGNESEDKEKPGWGVLRDDFMMGAKLKDWDKKEEDGDDVEEIVVQAPKKKSRNSKR